MSARAWLPRRFPRALVLAAIALLIGAVLGGVANAYWQSGGSGQGSAATTTAAAVVVSPGTTSATLYPGGQTDVTLTVANPNAFSVQFSWLTLDTSRGTLGFTVDAGHPGCDVSTLSFLTQTNDGAGWTVPAKADGVNGSLAITLFNALSMEAGASNACQGAAFSVGLAVGA